MESKTKWILVLGIVVVVVLAPTIPLVIVVTSSLLQGQQGNRTPAEQYAFIACTAQQFFGSEDVNEGVLGSNPNFTSGIAGWTDIINPGAWEFEYDTSRDFSGPINGTLNITTNGFLGIGFVRANAPVNCTENETYEFSCRIQTENIMGTGAGVLLEWYNNTNLIHTNISLTLTGTSNLSWVRVAMVAVAPQNATNVTVGFFLDDTLGSPNGAVWFDHAVAFHLNITVPTYPNTHADGFPAQGIQAYKSLKANGWDDDHIFIMLKTGDNNTSIEPPGTHNDLIDIWDNVDVLENCTPATAPPQNGTNWGLYYVNKSRFVQELTPSLPGSFASQIDSNDELLVYLIDHGSQNGQIAKFHFETGESINETEFDALLDAITCKQIILMVDMCFSGNFIDGCRASNRLGIAAAGFIASWYWTKTGVFLDANGVPQPHYAGSWYFHPFWESLNQSNTVQTADNAALNHQPKGFQTVQQIQNPMMYDDVGIASSWTI